MADQPALSKSKEGAVYGEHLGLQAPGSGHSEEGEDLDASLGGDSVDFLLARNAARLRALQQAMG